jgi:hypothetical protein
LVSVALEGPPDEREILRAPFAIEGAQCVGAGPDVCLVENVIRKNPDMLSSEDPRYLYLADVKAGTLARLEGPWGTDLFFDEHVLAPDGSFAAVRGLMARDGGTSGKYSTLFIAPRAGAPVGPIDIGQKSADIVGWTGRGPSLRVVVRRYDILARDDRGDYVSIDPREGKAVPLASPPPAADPALSPDGRLRVACRDNKEIVVTDVATKTTRSFAIHEDDRRSLRNGCVEWVSPRYLFYRTDARHGFVDVTTMKLSFLSDPPDVLASIAFTPDFAYALSTRDGQVFVGKVVVK